MPVEIGADTPGTSIQLIGDTVAPRILMIVTDKDSLDADKEKKLKRDLVGQFNAQIDIAESSADIDSGNWDLTRYDLIIVCNGVAPADVNNLKSVEVPVLSLDEDVSITALNMAATGGASSETQSNATDITHQIISEAIRSVSPSSIATGNKTVYKNASNIDWVTTLGAGGNSLTEDTGVAAQEHTVVYEENAVLQDTTLAAEIRIHFGIYQFNQLTATGKSLFRRTVEYAIYGARQGQIELETDVETIITNQSYNQNFGIRVGGFLPQGQELGDAFYVKSTGVDTADGKSWTNAVLTIDYCIGLTGTNDYIFIGNGAFDEDTGAIGITVDKVGITLVGPGHGLCTVENSDGAATIVMRIQNHDVEVTGLQFIEATNTVENIWMTGADDAYIHDCKFIGNAQTGIGFQGTNYADICRNVIANVEQQGILVEGVSVGNRIYDNQIFNAQSAGIFLNGDGVDGNFVYKNDINGGAGTTDYAIKITLGDNNYIDWNSMGELSVWPVFNSGSNNYFGPHNGADSISGTYNRTVANGTSLIATNVTNIDLWASGKYEFGWDLSTLVTAVEGGNVDGYIYSKVGGFTFIRRDMDRMVIGTDVLHPTCEKGFVGGDSEFQEGLQCSVAVTQNRLIYWRLIKC